MPSTPNAEGISNIFPPSFSVNLFWLKNELFVKIAIAFNKIYKLVKIEASTTLLPA